MRLELNGTSAYESLKGFSILCLHYWLLQGDAAKTNREQNLL